MKIRTIASRRKRHELRTMVLELAAKVDWKEVELLTANVENNKLQSEINELKSKFDLQGKILKDTTDKLIAQKKITDETVQEIEEMANVSYKRAKEINRLNDVIIAANREIDRRESINSDLNNTVSSLQLKVIELSNDNEQLKKPFWKKVKGCLVK